MSSPKFPMYANESISKLTISSLTSNGSLSQDIFEFGMSSVECQVVGISLFAFVLSMGSFLIILIINHVRDNQYATLLDYLVNNSLLIIMYTNYSGFVLWLARSCFGSLPLVVSKMFSLNDSVSFFLLSFIVDQTLLFKMLYVTCWKSVGQVNDDIFYEFFKALNITFAVLLVIVQIQFDTYLPEVMLFCTGDQLFYINKGLHINDYIGLFSVVFWVIPIAVISYQQKKLNTHSGFRTREGFHLHLVIIMFLLFLTLSRLPNELAFRFIEEGSLDKLPQALVIPLACTSSRVVLSVVMPMFIIAKSPSLQELLRMKMKRMFCQREPRVVPII